MRALLALWWWEWATSLHDRLHGESPESWRLRDLEFWRSHPFSNETMTIDLTDMSPTITTGEETNG